MMSDKREKILFVNEVEKSGPGRSSDKETREVPLDRATPFRRFRTFADKLKHGMKVEWHETRAVPGQLLRGEFRKAGEQVADLGRMGFLAALWVLPGGAILSGFVVKVFHRIRPSAFRSRRHGTHEREEPCD